MNGLTKNNRQFGRSSTAVYNSWKSEVAWMLRHQAQRPVEPIFKGNVIVVIGVERSNERADIDNLTKALLDALVRGKVIKDDSLVLGVATAWNMPGKRTATLAVLPAQNLSLEFHLAPTGAHGGWFLPAPTNEGEPSDGD